MNWIRLKQKAQRIKKNEKMRDEKLHFKDTRLNFRRFDKSEGNFE